MTDISKCAGFRDNEPDGFRSWCPLRAHCYRYTAKDAGAGQSWTAPPWVRDEYGNVTCEMQYVRKAG